MKLPFKLNGIYVHKIELSKEEINKYRSRYGPYTENGSNKEKHTRYFILNFTEIISKSSNSFKPKRYSATYANRVGEIFQIVDAKKNNIYSFVEYQEIKFVKKGFTFKNENILIEGFPIRINAKGKRTKDKLILKVTDKDTGKSYTEKLRYVPYL